MSWATNLNENDRGSDGKKTVELDKSLILILLVGTVKIKLLDTLDGQFFVLQCNFIGLRGKFGRVLVNVGGEGGGEKNDLDILWQQTAYG